MGRVIPNSATCQPSSFLPPLTPSSHWRDLIAGSALIRLIWRSGVWDAINGFRAFQTDSLRRLNLDATMHDIELQSTIRAARMRMRILEIATREQRRMGGLRKATAGTWTLLVSLGSSFARELFSAGPRADS